ncbi:sensor domain-containing diguanylate cyclase [Treponema pectinovorum]|uniref:sensor domain-containing diguanylate cyclase n=1 Tax=Treponema pectinovorum TaxID=164 RepID=UPI0011C80BD8|nr:GGDEF domain-containing protein [Treponema pectinovorum]
MSVRKDGKLRLSFKLTISFCIAFSAIVLVYTQKKNYAYKRERCQILTVTAATMFQSDMKKSIYINDVISSLLIETDGNISKFEKIIEKIILNNPSIERIQLAPKGIITDSFPPSVYDKKGKNMFESPITKESSNKSMNTREAYLLGPITFDSGKIILISGKPIFLESKNDAESFWGFSIIHLGVSNLFSKASLEFLNNSGYAYSLWRADPKTGTIQYIAKNTTTSIKNPCETVFAVADTWWTLSTAPKDGWINPRFMIFEILVALILSISISFGTVFVLSIKDREAVLENLSYRDSLTNLYNSRKFLMTLRDLSKTQKPYTLIYMDLNGFKNINDTLGHEAGDKVLIIVARRLCNCIKENDAAFRIGGDEFTIILQGANSSKFIEDIIQRIRTSIGREIVLDTTRLKMQCSAGYSRCPDESRDFEELIKIADKNMYLDKKRFANKRNEDGKNTDSGR